MTRELLPTHCNCPIGANAHLPGCPKNVPLPGAWPTTRGDGVSISFSAEELRALHAVGRPYSVLADRPDMQHGATYTAWKKLDDAMDGER